MPQLKIFCHIDPKIALATGLAEAGDVDLAISPDQVAELATHHLVDAAALYTGLEYQSVGKRLPVAGASWNHVIYALERVANDESRKRHHRAITALLDSFGNASQRTRWKSDALPNDELVEVARKVAFTAFDNFKRFVRLEEHDVAHDDLVCHGPDYVNATYASREVGATETETFRWRLMRFDAACRRSSIIWTDEKLDTQFTFPVVRPRLHIATCPVCKGSATRYSAMVQIAWLGRPLSREYALD